MTNQRYDHDCGACVFLGQFGSADLYFCPQGGSIPTVIARYSSSGADYTSGIFAGNRHPDLLEAKMRATARGLLGSRVVVPIAPTHGRFKGFLQRAARFATSHLR